MAKQTVSIKKYVKPLVTRPGVHAKTKTSNSKTNKNYVKKYRGQGR